MRIIIALLLSFVSLGSIAQCPFQIRDCKGKCPRFTDLNHDGYCDFTIITTPPPAVDTMLIRKDTHSIQISASTGNNAHLKKDSSKNHNITTTANTSQIATKNNNQGSAEISTTQQTSSLTPKTNNAKIINNIASQKKTAHPPAVLLYKRYPLLLISALCIGLYLFSFMLAKFKIIEIRIHRKIWNIILIITFLVTGLLGLFMVFELNYSIQVTWFKPLLIWHVSFGIGMAIISIFHFLWHWSYIKKIFNFRQVKSGKLTMISKSNSS